MSEGEAVGRVVVSVLLVVAASFHLGASWVVFLRYRGPRAAREVLIGFGLLASSVGLAVAGLTRPPDAGLSAVLSGCRAATLIVSLALDAMWLGQLRRGWWPRWPRHRFRRR